jgi:hypothetical protein
MAFIGDFLIGEADIASFSCYSKPPASAGGAFTIAVCVLLGILAVLMFLESMKALKSDDVLRQPAD